MSLPAFRFADDSLASVELEALPRCRCPPTRPVVRDHVSSLSCTGSGIEASIDRRPCRVDSRYAAATTALPNAAMTTPRTGLTITLPSATTRRGGLSFAEIHQPSGQTLRPRRGSWGGVEGTQCAQTLLSLWRSLTRTQLRCTPLDDSLPDDERPHFWVEVDAAVCSGSSRWLTPTSASLSSSRANE